MTRRRHRKSLNEKRYNLLEPRFLLAGDVTAVLTGSTLVIQGDGLANEVSLTSANGSIVLSGADTTINGGAASFDAGQFVKDVEVRMGAGNDQLQFTALDVQNNLTVFGDGGADRFVLDDAIARYIHVDGGAGNDTFDVIDAGTLKSTYFYLGNGDDVVAISKLVTGRNFRVYAGEGSDTIAANELHVGKHMYLEMLTGDDEVLLSGDSSVRKTTGVDLGFGDDTFISNPTLNNASAEFRKTVRVNAVDGNDLVSFDANNTFSQASRLDGGRGTDSIDQRGNELKEVKARKFETGPVENMNQVLDSVFANLQAADIDSTTFGGDGVVDEQTPTALTLTTTPASFTENGSAINLDSGLNLTGDSETTVSSATVTVGGFQEGEDQLAYNASIGSITGQFDNVDGELTLSGQGTLAEYRSALRAVTFQNTSESPATSNRSLGVSVVASDQTVSSSRSLTVASVNDVPQLTLGRETTSSTIAELPISLDATLSVSDVDDSQFESATVAITSGFVSGEDSLNFEAVDGIAASFDTATGVLSLTGAADISDFESILRSVTFDSTGSSIGDRTIEFEVSDGDSTQSATITLSLIQEDLEINVTASPVDYVENASAVVIDADLSLAPPSRSLTGATVAITNAFVEGQDILAVSGTDTGAISVVYDSATGVLTLSGDASVAEYQSVMRTVTYSNTSDDPGIETRAVEFTMMDGEEQVSATRGVTVTPVDDPLVIIAPDHLTQPERFATAVDKVYRSFFMVVDPDDEFSVALDSSNSGVPEDSDFPRLDEETLEFSWRPAETGLFQFDIVATNESGVEERFTILLNIVDE